MSTDLEQRLRDHYSILADELELPPSRVDDLLARSAAPTFDEPEAPVGTPTPRRSASRWFVAAAAVIVVVGGLGALTNRSGNDPLTNVELDGPPTLLSSIESLDADDWVIATHLPGGVGYMYALDHSAFDSARSVFYGNERDSGTTERLSITTDSGEQVEGEPIVIAGTNWQLDDPISGGWTAMRRLGTTTVVVRDSGPFDDEDRSVLAGLAVVKPDRMPSRPLGDESAAIVVAGAGPGAEFLVQESGGYWSTSIGGSGDCCSRIDTAAEGITVEGGSNVVAEGESTSRVTIGGTVLDAAELIQVEFSDGTVAETKPTDLSGQFDRKFWVIATDLPTGDHTPVEVRSYDATGQLLATVAAS